MWQLVPSCWYKAQLWYNIMFSCVAPRSKLLLRSTTMVRTIIMFLASCKMLRSTVCIITPRRTGNREPDRVRSERVNVHGGPRVCMVTLTERTQPQWPANLRASLPFITNASAVPSMRESQCSLPTHISGCGGEKGGRVFKNFFIKKKFLLHVRSCVVLFGQTVNRPNLWRN